MNEENRKAYRKLSLESMLFSAIGMILLIFVCRTPDGMVRYMAREAYQVILTIAAVIFIVGLIGFFVTSSKKGNEKQ